MKQQLHPNDRLSDQPLLQHGTVVVAIPTFNEERFVLETLRSVQSQTHGDFLAVISDNASTDRTVEICRTFCQADHRFIFIAQPKNYGASANFQWLFESTSSPYFIWLGGHDMISKDFLEKHMRALDSDPTLALSYANIQCVNQNSEFIRETDGGNYHRISGTPAQRYRRTLKRMGPAAPINNLFRRAALNGVTVKPVSSIDRMILCQAAYWGQFNKIEEPLYVKRFIMDREDGPVARLARIKGQAVSNPGHIETMREFLRQFMSLEKSWIERALLGMAVWSRYSKRIRKDITRGFNRRQKTV